MYFTQTGAGTFFNNPGASPTPTPRWGSSVEFFITHAVPEHWELTYSANPTAPSVFRLLGEIYRPQQPYFTVMGARRRPHWWIRSNIMRRGQPWVSGWICTKWRRAELSSLLSGNCVVHSRGREPNTSTPGLRCAVIVLAGLFSPPVETLQLQEAQFQLDPWWYFPQL